MASISKGENPMVSPKIKKKYGTRIAKKEDLVNVMEINENTLPENYPLFFYEQIFDRFPKTFNLAYVKNNSKKLIAYIMWRVEKGPSAFHLKYIRKAHMVSLAVLNDYRRNGIGLEIISDSMEAAKEYDIDEYVLEVRVSNSAAVRLYQEKLDYEIIKIVSNYYRDGEDSYYMCLNLDKRNRYIKGSKAMKPEDIVNYYVEKKKAYLAYNCPHCENLLLKSLNYSLPGRISPDSNLNISCAYCGKKILLYDIANGKHDVVKI